jgi:CRISPR-associated Csx2 family protein
MAKYIITFLGVFAKTTVYEFEGKQYTARVFPEALTNFVEFDRMYVCVTEQAKKKTYPILEELGDNRIKPIDIADGETTEQMWQNFNKIVGKFQPGDKVIFDITHAARSIPFLTFLFSAYLKVAKDVEILDVYYGASVFGVPSLQSSSNENPSSIQVEAPKLAPVIKLGEFVSMLDWMSATQQFTTLGDGNGLVTLLRGLQIQKGELSQIVEEMAEAIELVSDALIYIRPIEAMKAAAKIQQLVPQIKSAGRELAELQPFLLLVDQIDDKYKILALAEPMKSQNLYQNLSRQLDMISWYQDHQQQIKSIVLARELFVSILAYWLKNDPFDSNVRGRCGSILNNKELRDAEFDRFENRTIIWTAWISVRDPRNEYAHVGCTHDYKPIQELKDDIGRMINQSKDCLQKFLAEAKIRQPPQISLATARPIPKPRKRNIGGL